MVYDNKCIDIAERGNTGYVFDYWTKDNVLWKVNPGATPPTVPGGIAIFFKARYAETACGCRKSMNFAVSTKGQKLDFIRSLCYKLYVYIT